MASDLPAVTELGMPRVVAENFLGVSGPAGLPPQVVDTLHRAMTEVMERPDLKARLDELAIAQRALSQPRFAVFVRRQVGDWGPR